MLTFLLNPRSANVDSFGYLRRFSIYPLKRRNTIKSREDTTALVNSLIEVAYKTSYPLNRPASPSPARASIAVSTPTAANT